ncbi:HET-domain-containing protein [Hyaloscypha bicolor E]|uniref:HET-domain-containing protein n=1 Tax=Hyaloscypha bicolor E TaxID=1095630 RepID=A0A2J6SXT0_9HELO|nr:HET-domain-containing protein [Hyaloscypha bicolor E]PMD55579.1 HET-domain-containing protein [Hyaloscypha bicolor E]
MWIDAVCINQSDIEEMNHQVGQMSQIYSAAEKVVIWLGPETNTTEDAVAFMTYVVQHGESDDAAFAMADWIRRKFEDASQAFVFEALKNLFLRPWFKRAWIVQEVVLAKTVTVNCGSFCFDWKIIERFSNIFMHAAGQLGDANQLEKSKFAISCILNMSPLIHAFRSCDVLQALKNELADSGPPPLATILRKMRRQNASNPRDKVYAALGIGPASEREHPALQPDYGLSMARLFPLANGNYAGPEVHKEHAPEPLYKAGGTVSPTPYTFSSDLRTIGMGGYCFDEIVDVGALASESQEMLPVPGAMNSWRGYLVGKEFKEYISGGSLVEAFWRTVLCDIWPSRERKLQRIGDKLSDIDSFPPETPEEEKVLMVWARMKIGSWLRWRRLIVTKKGYIGMGPTGVRIGDTVAVLEGGVTPFILRKYGYMYRLVGESYVHGIMDGEVLEMAERGECTLEGVFLA